MDDPPLHVSLSRVPNAKRGHMRELSCTIMIVVVVTYYTSEFILLTTVAGDARHGHDQWGERQNSGIWIVGRTVINVIQTKHSLVKC